MSKALLQDESLYVGDKPHKRDVVMLDGSTGTFYIRDLRDAEIQRYFGALRDAPAESPADGEEEDDGNRLPSAALIAAGLCEPDGSPSITAEQAYRLKYAIRQRLLHAVLDANDLIKRAAPGN
jgi:hypothetical protein